MGSARMGTIAMKIRIAGLAVALLFAFAAHAQAPATTPPASMDELAIQSHGARLNGFIYRAAGAGASGKLGVTGGGSGTGSGEI